MCRRPTADQMSGDTSQVTAFLFACSLWDPKRRLTLSFTSDLSADPFLVSDFELRCRAVLYVNLYVIHLGWARI